jgi:hypothetical protein
MRRIPSQKVSTFTVPDISIDEISFLLGVDSIRNVSGIQTGALDPLHGMFWTWNSGYIMAKLEGSSEKVHSAGNRFTYDVGGFRTGMNTTRHINLARTPLGMKSEEIHIKADVNRWFKGNSEIKIAETPVCHSPGALAMRIADNYSSMFSIYSIQLNELSKNHMDITGHRCYRCRMDNGDNRYLKPKPVKFSIPKGWPQPAYDFSKNPLTEEGIALGRKLFYDGQLSKDGNFSCGACHQQFGAFNTYDHNLSHGFNNTLTTRNAPGLFNLAWQKEFMWDGGINHLDLQPLLLSQPKMKWLNR